MQNTGHRLTVSVIITVFQRSAFLPNAIDGALAQTNPADEIIVTDDSNRPEIREFCEERAGGKLRYRSNPSPLGVALNLRAAVKESSGDLVAILNDDDAWEPDFLEKMLPPLEENQERVLCFSDHWLMREDGSVDEAATTENTKRYGRHLLPPGEITDPRPLVLVQNGVPLAMASVFRKDAVDWSRLGPEIAGAYDCWLSCMLAASGRPFYYVNRKLTRYRLHELMETARQAADKNENMVFIFDTLLKENRFPAFTSHLRRKLAVSLRTCGRNQIQFGHPEIALDRFRQSLRTWPTARAAAGWLLARVCARGLQK